MRSTENNPFVFEKMEGVFGNKSQKEGILLKIQVLVAAMDQKDYLLPDKMNIQTEAVIGNQCDRNSVESFLHNGHRITYLNFAERGVGLNRNNALMRADADICLFADDDLVYSVDYPEIVAGAFGKYSNADVLIFNVDPEPKIKKAHRVNFFNYMRYGAVRIAVKLSSVREQGVYFNQSFGGGTEHSAGEDTLFLTDCLRRGLKIYAVPYCIGSLCNDRESTWFRGYNDKYFRDKGCLYRVLSRKWWKLLCFQDALRHQKLYQCSWRESYRKMKNVK